MTCDVTASATLLTPASTGRPSATVGLHEIHRRVRYLAIFNKASAHFIRDIHGHVTGPTFSGVEGDDADRLLYSHDSRLRITVSRSAASTFVSRHAFPIRPKFIQHEIGVLLEPEGRNGWRGTHYEVSKPTDLSKLPGFLENGHLLLAGAVGLDSVCQKNACAQ